MNNLSKIFNNYHTWREEISDFSLYIFGYRHVKIFLPLLLVVNFLIWALAFYIDKKIPDQQIALHYNVDFGIDYYGDISNIYIIPLLGIFFIFFNILLLAAVKKNKDFIFLSYLMFSISLITNLILTVGVISIFIINY